MKKSNFYILAGVLFVFLQVVAIARNLYSDFIYFFWFCDFVPIILAVAFFFKKYHIVKGIVNIGLFPQLIYMSGFIVRIFFGISFLDETEILLTYDTLMIFLSILFHLATVIAFAWTYKIKPTKETLAYSLLGLVLIYLVMLFFTTPADDINYVFSLSNFFGVDAFSVFWIPITFLLVVLPTQGFQYLIYRCFGR